MNDDFLFQLARQIFLGNIRLGVIRDTFGSEIASQVYNLHSQVTASNWVRRVR